uniref:Uncharacterized protein n=1 Tax=Siphoviridae sp. ctDcW16 TaxID=2826199 RepID=A0A8S5MTH0_9CAUD|nr:MAG TPA: hypothetical protein [Siphoviridae sp. ctDcW16]
MLKISFEIKITILLFGLYLLYVIYLHYKIIT